ncbi:adhesion G protein-coupled receptor E5-like [Myiozetetes cayanensis]|uniref:adhesion G protein-coupled receptor E5-like n=1 Tax=Myiozetetes cayanensis TaxID=478635 RepID=UPI00215E0590|nr:adhesion G protein-coupled receptor E5-like [Myiozetetes cayanensis]
MFLEGLFLHTLLVRVFPPPWLSPRLLLLGVHGGPALVVAVAASAFPGGYGTPRYCWLSLARGSAGASKDPSSSSWRSTPSSSLSPSGSWWRNSMR